MGYSVKCDCGRVLEVRAGDAGSRVTCDCSRAVAVPSLHVLRRTAGEAPVSAEMMIRAFSASV